MEIPCYLLLFVMLMPNAPFHNLLSTHLSYHTGPGTKVVVGGPFILTGEAVTGKVTVLESDYSKLSCHTIWKAS